MEKRQTFREEAKSRGVGLHLECEVCKQPIDRPGGLLFGPPDDGRCRKIHVCHSCWFAVVEAFNLELR